MALACSTACVAAGTPLLKWSDVKARADLKCELATNGRDRLTFTLANRSGAPVILDIPAGLTCTLNDRSGDVISLRAAQLLVLPKSSGEAILPAAALSSKTAALDQPCSATGRVESKLAPLLTYLANRPDVPRATTQIVVLSLMENATFEQWKSFLATGRRAETAPAPTAAEVVEVVDALTILRKVAPDASLALGRDSQLKLLALRNPACRSQAMQLFGMTVPTGDRVTSAIPTLGELLHRVPGDNCPICRARARMQQAASDF